MPESFDQLDKFVNATRRFREQVDFITLAGDIVFFEAASTKTIDTYKASGNGTKELLRNLKTAFSINLEFGNHSGFRKMLEDVFSKPEIIFLYPDTASQSIKCEVLAEQYAGNADDYETAVKTVRASVSESEDPITASIAWNTMYKVAREGKQLTSKKGDPLTEKMEKMYENYYRTIEERLTGLILAPFWYILNYGSNAYGEAVGSAGKGVAYPHNPPTHFIEEAEYGIQVDINILLKEEIDRMIEEFEAEIEKFAEQLDEYSPGEIITTLKLGHQNFVIYKTPKLGKLGFRRL